GGVVAFFSILGWLPRGWLKLALARARASLALLAAAASHPAASSRFGLLLAGTVTGCLLAVRALGVPRGNWVVVSTLLVLRPEAGGTRRRALERLEGTLLGCVLAGGLIVLLHSVVLADVLIFLLLVGYFRLPPGSPWALAFFTPAVVLGVGLLEPGHWQWALNRALDVVAGTLVALAVGLLFGAREPPRAL